MLKNHADFSRRALLLAIASIFSSAAMPLDIYQGPMVAERSMDPNVIYIHDDSGSMASTHMPDEQANNASGTAPDRSAFINKQFYNPDITYQPPMRYDGGRLISYGNIDELCGGFASRRVSLDGFNGAACGYTLTDANNSTGTPTGIGGATTSPPNPYSAIYFDYVPGMNSRIDNPNYRALWLAEPIRMIDGRMTVNGMELGDGLTTAGARRWNNAPENVDGNYETHAFRAVPAGNNALFYRGGAGKVNQSQANNNSDISNRACPILFKDVPQSRAYYNDTAGAPGLPGNPHATCRFSYRTGDVDFTSNYQAYTTTAPNAGTVVAGNIRAREWCRRSDLPTAANFLGTNRTRSCYTGRHLIGDTNGDGKWDASDNLDAFVSDYESANAVASNIRDQSLRHLVSKFVQNNDGGQTDILVEPTPRRRTAREEWRNFANWFSYYRTRSNAAKSGISLAFANMVNRYDTTQPGTLMRGRSIRLGYDTINKMTAAGPGQRNGAVTTAGRGVVPFLDNPPGYPGKRFVEDFYDWVRVLPAGGGTPLRSALDRAGKYLMNSKKPWLEYPPDTWNGAGSGETFGCRRAFTILMTDGYYNDSFSSVGDVDKNDGPVIWKTDASNTALTSDLKNRYQYTRQSPFFGENPGSAVSNSLADVAMYYWNRDLQSTIPNLLAPTKKDPAFWQHMQTFTIGLGVIGRMSDTEVNLFLSEGSNRNILWTFPTGLDTEYEKIDDLMHAGLNGHGGTSAAEDAGEFVGKLTALLTEIAGQDGSNTSPAVPRGLSNDSLAFEASYSPSDWTGELLGKKICLAGSTDPECSATDQKASIQKTVWSAQELLSARVAASGHAVRNIFTQDSGSAALFDTGLSASAKAAIDVDLNHSAGLPVPENCIMARPNLGNPPTGDACLLKRGRPGETAYTVDHLIEYLRGEQQFEDTTTGSTVNYNGFRRRSYTNVDGKKEVKLLGDIVNSSPDLITNLTIESNWDQAGALGASTDPSIPATGDAASYKLRKALFTITNPDGTRRVNTANREQTVLVGAGDGMLHAFDALTGQEQFAYVPEAVHGILKKLADPQYSQIDTLKHSFYVDGTTISADIVLNSNWATVAVGSTGRSDSGKSSYFALNVEKASTFDAGDVIWEFSHSDLGVPGNGRAEITLLPDGKWTALLGNGYNSANHKAGLFLVQLASGAAFEFIDTGVGSSGTPNGLGTPAFAVFEVESTDPVSATNSNPRGGMAAIAYAGDLLGNVWKFDLVEKTAHKLLEAEDALGKPQPITAPPRLIIQGDAVQVVVGTGKFLEQSDVDNTDPQTIYSVRDNCGVTIGCIPPVATRGALLKFADTSTTTKIDYAVTQGFYLDLSDLPGMAGARVIGKATGPLKNEKDVKTPHTLLPFLKPSVDPCASSVEGFNIEFDAFNGKIEKSLINVAAALTDGYYLRKGGNGEEASVSGTTTKGTARADDAFGKFSDDDRFGKKDKCVWLPNEVTGVMECIEIPSAGDKKGRQSWRQLR